jgi:hypothetical protein
MKSPIQVQNYDFILFANFVRNETKHYEQKNSRVISLTKKTIWNMQLNETTEQLRLLQLTPQRYFMNPFHADTDNLHFHVVLEFSQV